MKVDTYYDTIQILPDEILQGQKPTKTLQNQIKNERHPTPKSEIMTKIKMCKFFEIVPVFATRWLEMYRKPKKESVRLLWQFKKQFYPRGHEEFVKTIRKRFKIPVQTCNLPHEAIRDMEEWILKQ